VNARYNPKDDLQAILAYADRPDADPAARFALISTLTRYQEQIRQLQQLKEAIDEHGTMMSMRDSYGTVVLIENPAVKTYSKIAAQADTTVQKLLKIYNAIR